MTKKILDNRLKMVLPKLIAEAQGTFVRGHDIMHHINTCSGDRAFVAQGSKDKRADDG